jgi:hypothetical protein
MRVILAGVILSFRYVTIGKDAQKVGQVDVLQAGDKRFPAKVVPVYIPSSAYCRLILEQLNTYREPYITLLIQIIEGRELQLEVLEVLQIQAEELLPDGVAITS